MIVVGTWGTGIFSDDTACDVRSVYRANLESGVTDSEAMHDILSAYGTEDGVVWLALSATQSALGRLDPMVRDRAIQIIDGTQAIDDWGDASARDQQTRRRALSKLRETLTGPQPARRPVAVKWRHHTDLFVGDVLVGDLGVAPSLWVVVDVKPDPPTGTHPWMRRLDAGAIIPTSADHVLDGLSSGAIRPSEGWREIWAIRTRRRSPDWAAAGFRRLPAVTPRDVKGAPRVGYVGITWTELSTHLASGTNPFSTIDEWAERSFSTEQ